MLLLVVLGRCPGRLPENLREMTLARETNGHGDLDDEHPSGHRLAKFLRVLAIRSRLLLTASTSVKIAELVVSVFKGSVHARTHVI
jgi:hypothetical protein